MCSSGDAGKGPDNYAPNYAIVYELNGDKDAVVQLVTAAAKNNGHALTYQASPYSYISWYKDQTGKPSTYPGLNKGNVTISFSIYEEGGETAFFKQGNYHLGQFVGIVLGYICGALDLVVDPTLECITLVNFPLPISPLAALYCAQN